MVDKAREAGVLVQALGRALLDGTRDLKTIPPLIIKIVDHELWRYRVDPSSGREYEFRSWNEFVITSGPDGLGTTREQLRGVCRESKPALDALDRAEQNKVGRPSKTLDNIQGFPSGTSEASALRRLRKDRPDLHTEVLAERLSAHAAMVKAGFRPRTVTVRIADPESVAKALHKHMTPDDLAALRDLL